MKRWFSEWRSRQSRRRALHRRGYALYCGYKMYFPVGSHVYQRVVADGLYEPEIVEAIIELVKPSTVYIDVGAHIGLLSLPVLSRVPGAQVISVETGPDILPYLARTHEESRQKNWTLVKAAVGAETGVAEFWSGDAASCAFAGLADTGRGGDKRLCHVPMRTLDAIWREVGCPPVSLIKLDIEGGEMQALRGAQNLIRETGAAVVMEWSRQNLSAYSIAPEAIFELCEMLSYDAYSVPGLVRIDSEPILRLKMRATDTFLMLPRKRIGRNA